MNLTTTLLFYLTIGGAVAMAVHLASGNLGRELWFRTATAVVFWPLYLPTLLQRPMDDGTNLAAASEAKPSSGQVTASPDEISVAIQQVEAELELALSSLDGWSDAVLSREQHRFEELRTAWHTQAQKIRELDQLLNQPAFAAAPAIPVTESPGERVASCERARRENIVRLQAVRGRLHDDLLNTLAWVRELVTMIHLAKYTGAPASRAEELVVQIATAVEGLSEVAAWKNDNEVIMKSSPTTSVDSLT